MSIFRQYSYNILYEKKNNKRATNDDDTTNLGIILYIIIILLYRIKYNNISLYTLYIKITIYV